MNFRATLAVKHLFKSQLFSKNQPWVECSAHNPSQQVDIVFRQTTVLLARFFCLVAILIAGNRTCQLKARPFSQKTLVEKTLTGTIKWQTLEIN